jgi:hypothetical protein
MANTDFTYQYRDASDQKITMTIVMEGSLTREELKRLKSSFKAGVLFVPGQVGLMDLQNSFRGRKREWDPDYDYPYHTIDGIFTRSKAPPTQGAPKAADLLARFEAVEWDDNYKPPFYEEMKARYDARIAGEEVEDPSAPKP